MTKYTNEIHDEERAFYGIRNAEISNCRFEGPSDGESALKEASDIKVSGCRFLLRYPFWHVENADISDTVMTDTCRAALWYDKNIQIRDSVLDGIKALRECTNTEISGSHINSSEFGWFCHGLKIYDTKMISEYPFLKSFDMELNNFNLTGKYSFQYTENVVIRNSILNTKDAFWHSKGVSVYDSTVKGEYLGWYSDSLRLVRCTIVGTQPLCYTQNLILEDCIMQDCDLSFEKSDVKAYIKGKIDSVKNPLSGYITADEIGEIIVDDTNSHCEIVFQKPSGA